MRSLRGSIWSDKRLWVAAFLAFVFRTYVSWQLGPGLAVVEGGSPHEAAALAPSRPVEPEPGLLEDIGRSLRDQRIRRIRADGSSAEPLMSPESAAAWGGGLVLFLGGFGAVWLWRRSEQDADGDEQIPAP